MVGVNLLRLRRLAALGALTGTLALVGCGGGASPGSSGELPEGAAHVPGNTIVFVSVQTDFASDQWQTVEELLARFPSGEGAISSLLERFESEGIEVERDLKPALGPEVDVAVLALPTGEDTLPMLVLTRPSDPAKLEALLADSDSEPAWVVEDGWYVVAESQEILDRAFAAETSLAEEDGFAEALGRIDSDALARVYVNGDELLAAVAGAAGKEAPGLDLGSLGMGGFDGAAVGITAEGRGVRIEGVALAPDAVQPETFGDELAQLAPADALAYAAFGSADESLRELIDTIGSQTPELDSALAQAQLALGISVEDDLLPILAGPAAFWIREGDPIPEVTLVLSPEDPGRALLTLDKLAAGLGTFAAASGEASPRAGETESIAGVEARTLELEELTIYYAVVDDYVVVTTATSGIEGLVGGGPGLAASPAFQEAAQAAGMPDETAGILYVDVDAAFGFLEAAGALGTSTPEQAEALDNARTVDYLLLYGTGAAGESRVEGFVGIG